jgi:hypothetical protein
MTPTLSDALAALQATPPAEGHLRLYRIEPCQPVPVADWLREALQTEGVWAAQGRWFTQDTQALPFYAADQAHVESALRWVDVPTKQAHAWRVSHMERSSDGLFPQRFSRDPENEFFLPPEKALTAKRVVLEKSGAAPQRRGPRA